MRQYILQVLVCLVPLLMLGQQTTSKLLSDGFNSKLKTEKRIQSLHSAAKLLTNTAPDSSVLVLDKADQLNKKLNNVRLQQENHLIRAKTLLIQGVYPKALEFAQKALKLSEQLKNKELISDCYSVIGQIYERQQNNQQEPLG